jgi:hypothetical protein
VGMVVMVMVGYGYGYGGYGFFEKVLQKVTDINKSQCFYVKNSFKGCFILSCYDILCET